MPKRRRPEPVPPLCTVTGEPFQPVRLYYKTPEPARATKALSRLRCMDEDRDAGCWVWLYEKEAAKLEFGMPRRELNPAVHPIVIGRFKVEGDGMVLAVRSVPRAIAAARFFRPRFGAGTVLARARILNRLLAVPEAAAGLDRLDQLLDQDVTVVSPGEQTKRAAPVGWDAIAEKLSVVASFQATGKKKDVPLVEDFPVQPESETDDMRLLTFMLELRSLRALEHWHGSRVTLPEMIAGFLKGRTDFGKK